MTRTAINDIFLTVSLMAQCALVAVLFFRGFARRLPVFALLNCFYVARSLLLLFLAGRLAPALYAGMYNGLSLTDVLLQFLLAVSIALKLVREAGGWTASRLCAAIAIPGIASVLTCLFIAMLPSHTPVPPDRMQCFDSLVMILLSGLGMVLPLNGRAPLVRKVVLGLSCFAVLSLCSTGARTLAAFHRDAHSFAEWAYILSAGWVGVVAYWIVVVWCEENQPRRLAR